MASEGRLTCQLSIQKRDATSGRHLINYRHGGGSFVFDVDGNGGPSPGSFLVSISGTDLNLSQVTTPGMARFVNQDATNYVVYGPYDPDTDVFYPLGEILPNEEYVLRLHRFFLQERTGTGTLPGSNSSLRFVADTAPCWVTADVFSK